MGADGLSLADPASGGVPLRRRGNFGLYALVDQQMFRSGARSAGAFIRGEVAPNDRNLVNFYADAGVSFAARRRGRTISSASPSATPECRAARAVSIATQPLSAMVSRRSAPAKRSSRRPISRASFPAGRCSRSAIYPPARRQYRRSARSVRRPQPAQRAGRRPAHAHSLLNVRQTETFRPRPCGTLPRKPCRSRHRPCIRKFAGSGRIPSCRPCRRRRPPWRKSA